MGKSTERLNKFSKSVKGFIVNNPVLERGLPLAPIVVASGYLKNAVALSIAFFIIAIPTIFIASIMKDKVQTWIRAFLYALIASVFYPLAFLAVNLFGSQVRLDIGIYLPLTIINSIIIYRAEKCAVKSKPHIALADGFMYGLGYTATLCGVAVIREVFGHGTIWGVTVPFVTFPISGITLPFFGFILLGLLSAFYHMVGKKLIHFANKKDEEHENEKAGDIV